MEISRIKEFLLAIDKSLKEMNEIELGDLIVSSDYIARHNKGLEDLFTIVHNYALERLFDLKKAKKSNNLDKAIEKELKEKDK